MERLQKEKIGQSLASYRDIIRESMSTRLPVLLRPFSFLNYLAISVIKSRYPVCQSAGSGHVTWWLLCFSQVSSQLLSLSLSRQRAAQKTFDIVILRFYLSLDFPKPVRRWIQLQVGIKLPRLGGLICFQLGGSLLLLQ